MKIRYLVAGFCAGAVFSMPTIAGAWGFWAHRATGHIAEYQLTDTAREAIADLLGDEEFAEATVWADRVRPDRPPTAPFHYVNGPRGVLEPGEDDLALDAGNVYSAILGFAEILADEEAPREERAEALKFLIHFIGDLHQPLHCGFADDRGGNSFAVLFRGQRSNIHRVWDTQIFADKSAIYSSGEYAAILFERYSEHERDQWTAVGDPAEWVIEGRRIIFNGLYPVPRTDVVDEGEDPIAVIDDSYIENWLPTAEKRVAMAGARMAATLNAIFETGASPFDSPPIDFPPYGRQDFGPAQPVFSGERNTSTAD